MIKSRKGIKNPRLKARDFLTEKGFFFETECGNADVYIGEGLRIIIDFDDDSISWLVPLKRSIYHIGRTLRFDPILSGDELADMVMEGAKEIGRTSREEFRK